MEYEFLNKALLLEFGGEQKKGKGKNKGKVKRILVLGDLHIGWEESLNQKGIFVPRLQFKQIMKELEDIFKNLKKRYEKGKSIDEVVILGDLKHEFGTISKQEWQETEKVLDFFKENIKSKKNKGKIILIKGNHDTILKPIAKRKDLEVKDYYIIKGDSKGGEICFLHGHKIFPECLDKKIKILIMGHRHPVISLSDKYKKEKYKCFLIGKWKKKQTIILPSFFPFVRGSDVVNMVDTKTPVPESCIKNFDVYVIDDKGKIYKFGKLKRII